MKFFEARLRLDLRDVPSMKTKLSFYEKLGVKNVIIEPLSINKRFGADIKRDLRSFTKMHLYYRCTLNPSNPKQLKNLLKEDFSLFDFLAVESPLKEVQLQASRDTRIDVITFSQVNNLKQFAPGIISLTKQNRSFIEFSLGEIMNMNFSYQSKFFRILYRSIHNIIKEKGNLIMSGNFEDIYDFRNPRALISVCHTLLNIDLSIAKKIFGENVQSLIERAKKRKRKDWFESGVHLIR